MRRLFLFAAWLLAVPATAQVVTSPVPYVNGAGVARGGITIPSGAVSMGTTTAISLVDVRATRTSLNEGRAAGPPTTTPTLAEGAAGLLDGTYQYAYTETDGWGETTLSPAASITVAGGKQVSVTIGLPRRGISQRRLYRTVAGGATFKLLHDFGGGSGWAQTIWVDNVADGSLGATAPTSDTTRIYSLDLVAGVKTFRTHPDQGSSAADVTVLTGNAAVGGAFALDVYGQYYGRSYTSDTFASEKTGLNGNHYTAYWRSDTDAGQANTTVWALDANGFVNHTPNTLVDTLSAAWRLTATLPAVTTGTRSGASLFVTSAGSSAQSQIGLTVSLAAGYTGATAVYAANATTNVASTGTTFGSAGTSSGASALGIGLSGQASGATNNIGVFGGLGASGDGAGVSGAIVANNGATTKDIFVGMDNGSVVFEVIDGGTVKAPAYRTTTALITAVDGGLTGAFTANMVGATGGPATAAQNGWVKMQDSGGNTVWVPVWK